MFNNDETQAQDQEEENVTEFGMRKDGEQVMLWVMLDGQEVFYAEPHVKMCKGAIQAGVQTFLSRAFQKEIIDLATDDTDNKGVF